MPSSRRILIVDDSEEFLEAAAPLLEAGPGVVVAWAPTGEEALEMLERVRVDLVLLDLVLPGRSGLEVARQIKALPQPPKVVMVTLHDSDRYRQAAEGAGADGFVSKADFGTAVLPLIRRLLAGGDDR